MKILRVSIVTDTENEAKLIVKAISKLSPFPIGYEIQNPKTQIKKKGKNN